MSAALGRLKLRDVWAFEDKDFTPWLAREENLAELAATIGMELAPESTEEPVGSFNADLFCKDVADGSWVVIENQLEKTDHTHLGQLMTYAAGLHAVTCIWIAKQFDEQHRAAIAWLNEITDQDFRFFALEVELWRIGTSAPAPKFNIVAQPNDWSRTVKRATHRTGDGQVSATGKLYVDYWTKLFDVLKDNEPKLRIPSAKPQHWQPFSIGRTGFVRTIKVSKQKKSVSVEIFISNDSGHPEAFFNLLKDDRDAIDRDLRRDLDDPVSNVSWEPLATSKGSRIAIYDHGADVTNTGDWPKQHAWLVDHLMRFDKVFRHRIQQLDVSDYEPQEQDDADEAA